jgi:anti-sigma regulatory factor (Ser/Thr protein kinase)
VADAEQFDDITMLGFSYRGPEGSNSDDSTKRLSVEAKIENLDEVLAFVDGILESHECPIKIQMQMDIAVEEIFVNIAHYAYAPNTGKATISATFDAKSRVISFSFIDSGVPFDPLQKKDPDISQKLEDRKIGGLGIYMVKQSMDNVRYENRDGLNILTIEKKI